MIVLNIVGYFGRNKQNSYAALTIYNGLEFNTGIQMKRKELTNTFTMIPN